VRWLSRVRQSMATLTSQYSSNRALREYLERAYLPAAERYDERSAKQCAVAKEVDRWARRLTHAWPNLHISEPSVTTDGADRIISAAVYFGDIDQADVATELYADAGQDGRPIVLPMTKGDPLPGAMNGNIYSVRLEVSRPAADFTVRVVPAHPGVELPAELPLIAWQR